MRPVAAGGSWHSCLALPLAAQKAHLVCFFDIVQTILRSLQSWQPEPKGKAVAVGQARIRLAVE